MNKRISSDKSGPGRTNFIRRAALSLAAAALCFLALSGCNFNFDPGAPEASGAPTRAPQAQTQTSIVINEVVSSNAFSFVDPKLGSADWIELKNVSSEAVDISGWRLAGNPAMRDSFTFPEGVSIEPNGLLTLFCVSGYDGSEGSEAFVAPFGISRTGERIYLSDGGETPVSLDIPALSTDISWARAEDGSYGYSWSPTFGEENANMVSTLDEALSASVPADGLRFSELVIGSAGWVELENTSGAELDLSLFALSDDPADPVKWRFPSIKLGAGELITVELNELDPEAPLAASFKVSRTEGAIYLFDARRNQVDVFEVDPAMPDGVSAVREGDTVAYTAFPTKGEPNSEYTFPAIEWTAMDLSDPSSVLFINEVLPDNKYGITDSYGDRSDWVELINVSDNPVYLSGYYLSDDENDPLKWQLPNVALLPKGYVLIFLSGRESVEGEIHAPFSLSKEDGGIWLSRLDGMKQDMIPIPSDLNHNVSIGRNARNELRYYAAPTPGAPNSSYGTERSADAGGFNARSVYISEVSAAAPARSGEDDWIELYNGSSDKLKLEGWSLTDDIDKPRKFKLDSVSISAGGFAVIRCGSGGGKAPFSVSNGGDTIYLIDPQGAVRDVFQTGATYVGVTSGRASDSADGERCFFAKATRGSKNASPLKGVAAEPVFSKTGLYYDSEFYVELSCSTPGAKIRYTTDGSEPTESSKLCEGAIKISSNTILRARSFAEGFAPSQSCAHTYLIRQPHTLPVVCLSLSKSDYSRMYVSHMNEKGGVTKGDEVGCFMEYYIDGRLAVSSGAGVRVSGASTSVYSQKSLGLFFRAGYGRSSVDFPFFDDNKISSFRSLVLRNGGQDAYSARLRDTFTNRICRGLDLDMASVRPVIVYINGQYWGIYDMKENMNEDYVAGHFGVERDTVETARRNGYMKAGNKEQWKKMLEMCRTLDFTDQANFDALAKLVDVDSIKDYLIARTYFYDYDMYNQMYWHTNDNKVKWRAVLFDSDFAMAGNSSSANMLSVYFNPNGHTSPHGYVTQLDIFCALNQNPRWREEFIVRYIWAIKYRFNAEKSQQMLDKLAAIYKPELKEHIARWHMPKSYSAWEEEISTFRRCLGNRPEKALENLRRFYGLSESKFAELEKLADKMAGK